MDNGIISQIIIGAAGSILASLIIYRLNKSRIKELLLKLETRPLDSMRIGKFLKSINLRLKRWHLLPQESNTKESNIKIRIKMVGWFTMACFLLLAVRIAWISLQPGYKTDTGYNAPEISGNINDFQEIEDSNIAVEKNFPEEINTGWIFIGYYDFSLKTWQQGPYVKIVHRANQYDKSMYPIIGDVIEIMKPRNIAIYNYKYSGTIYQFDAPADKTPIMRSGIDYTGFVLAVGSMVEVRDCNIGHERGRPDSIWCRVGP